MPITLRLAREDDKEHLLQWRNDPDTVAACLSGKPVTREEHEAWFAATMADPDTTIFIGEADDEPVGVVRFTPAPEKLGAGVELHLNLAPHARGRGIGTELIREATRGIFTTLPDLQCVWLIVLPDNTAAIRAYEKVGYIIDRSDDIVVMYYLREQL